MSRRMRRANRVNAGAAVLIGDDEVAKNAVTLRDLDSGEQVEVPIAGSALIEKLKALQ
jgi:histidyl-tRNA synthetase